MLDFQTFGIFDGARDEIQLHYHTDWKWQIPKLFVSSQCDEPLHTLRENISFLLYG